MTEPELGADDGEFDEMVRRDGVMERLAKLLADAAAPNSRDRLKDALMKGDFAQVFKPDDPAD